MGRSRVEYKDYLHLMELSRLKRSHLSLIFEDGELRIWIIENKTNFIKDKVTITSTDEIRDALRYLVKTEQTNETKETK